MPILPSEIPTLGACPSGDAVFIPPGGFEEWDTEWNNIIESTSFENVDYQEPFAIKRELLIPNGRWKITVEQTSPGSFGTAGIWHNWEPWVAQLNAEDPPFVNGFRFLVEAEATWLIAESPDQALLIEHGESRFDAFVDAAGTHEGETGAWQNTMRPIWNYFQTDVPGQLDICACNMDNAQGVARIEVGLYHRLRQPLNGWNGDGTPPNVTITIRLEQV